MAKPGLRVGLLPLLSERFPGTTLRPWGTLAAVGPHLRLPGVSLVTRHDYLPADTTHEALKQAMLRRLTAPLPPAALQLELNGYLALLRNEHTRTGLPHGIRRFPLHFSYRGVGSGIVVTGVATDLAADLYAADLLEIGGRPADDVDPLDSDGDETPETTVVGVDASLATLVVNRFIVKAQSNDKDQ